jgi:hypothetical protein
MVLVNDDSEEDHIRIYAGSNVETVSRVESTKVNFSGGRDK